MKTIPNEREQKIHILDRSYKVIESHMRLRRNRETMVETLRSEYCIAAEDIAKISPWVMEGNDATEILQRTVWYEKDGSFKDSVSYAFHNAVCIEYWEEYDNASDQILLWFRLEAEAITRSNGAQDAAIERLFE